MRRSHGRLTRRARWRLRRISSLTAGMGNLRLRWRWRTAPAAQVSEGGDFNRAAFHVFLDFLRGQHVMERVVERAEVRRDLFVEVARQKAEGFAGFDGGPGENDP